MTKRNPVKEWRQTLERRTDVRAMRPVKAKQPSQECVATAPDELPAWLRRTRAVAPGSTMLSQGAETILVLQRANKLLQQRFGIDWAGAASVVFEEAQRRAASPASVARVLTAGLRRDARGRGGA
jgi:hypothetical protein